MAMRFSTVVPEHWVIACCCAYQWSLGMEYPLILVRYLEFESDIQGVSHYFQDSVLIFKNS
jgi:hypothetical protein